MLKSVSLFIFLVVATVVFNGCSHSTSPNGGGPSPSLTVGGRYSYDVWAYDLQSGDSVGFAEVDTVIATNASVFGRTGVIQYNDSTKSMLPYLVINESGISTYIRGYMQSPPYYAPDASGDLWYPAVLSVHDTVGGQADSTMTWWRLPFGTKQSQSYSPSSGTDVISNDTVVSLNDSTYAVGGRTYTTKRVEIRQVSSSSEVHIRVAYAPELQTIVQTTWLLELQPGQFLPVGGKSLTQIR
jgi:hypothetical protein